LKRIEAKRAGRLPPASNAKPHLLVPWLWDIVHDRRIVDGIAALLGPNILCYASSLIIKEPGDARYVAWHQDATYWGLSVPEAVTAWIAFTPSVAENGCVRVVPQTHRVVLEHYDTRDRENLLGRRESLSVAVDEGAAVDLVLNPGEASFHHPLIVHGSRRNESKIRRIGFAVRYIAADNAQADGRRNMATLVRGRDLGFYELEQAPEGEFHPVAVARHARVLRRTMSTIFGSADFSKRR
jgi:ectoine hydroxylase-related dioxygenase (phytanoyl-CoA dioxygenase family)